MKNEAHWRIVSLEDVAEIQTGLSKNANRQGESVTLPYLRVANVQDGRFDLSEVKTIEVPKDAVERFRVRPGDVLLTEGGDFDKLGRGAVWRGQINECVHQNHIFVVRPNRAWLDERFLAYQTQGPRGRAYFQSCSKQSTNLASINSTQLRQFPTALPPLGEQRKIADILTTWDEALEKLDALIKAKEGRKKALMQQLLTGKKRLNGFVKPWKFVPLGRLLESADRYRKWDDGRVARLAGVRRNGGGVFFRAELPASEIKVKTAKIICEGDFLISRRQITYGGMAVVPRRFDGFEVNDEYEVLVSRDPDKMDIRGSSDISPTHHG